MQTPSINVLERAVRRLAGPASPFAATAESRTLAIHPGFCWSVCRCTLTEKRQRALEKSRSQCAWVSLHVGRTTHRSQPGPTKPPELALIRNRCQEVPAAPRARVQHFLPTTIERSRAVACMCVLTLTSRDSPSATTGLRCTSRQVHCLSLQPW